MDEIDEYKITSVAGRSEAFKNELLNLLNTGVKSEPEMLKILYEKYKGGKVKSAGIWRPLIGYTPNVYKDFKSLVQPAGLLLRYDGGWDYLSSTMRRLSDHAVILTPEARAGQYKIWYCRLHTIQDIKVAENEEYEIF